MGAQVGLTGEHPRKQSQGIIYNIPVSAQHWWNTALAPRWKPFQPDVHSRWVRGSVVLGSVVKQPHAQLSEAAAHGMRKSRLIWQCAM